MNVDSMKVRPVGNDKQFGMVLVLRVVLQMVLHMVQDRALVLSVVLVVVLVVSVG